MAIKRFTTKQPYEEYYVEFDFTNALGTATIASATGSATNNGTGADATSTVITAASQMNTTTSVFIWVKAGTSGVPYKITAKAIASARSKYELDGLLPVTEV